MDRLADCLVIGGETALASRVTVRVPAWPMRLGLSEIPDAFASMPLLLRHLGGKKSLLLQQSHCILIYTTLTVCLEL